jgi:hypothetical protein
MCHFLDSPAATRELKNKSDVSDVGAKKYYREEQETHHQLNTVFLRE